MTKATFVVSTQWRGNVHTPLFIHAFISAFPTCEVGNEATASNPTEQQLTVCVRLPHRDAERKTWENKKPAQICLASTSHPWHIPWLLFPSLCTFVFSFSRGLGGTLAKYADILFTSPLGRVVCVCLTSVLPARTRFYIPFEIYWHTVQKFHPTSF